MFLYCISIPAYMQLITATRLLMLAHFFAHVAYFHNKYSETWNASSDKGFNRLKQNKVRITSKYFINSNKL